MKLAKVVGIDSTIAQGIGLVAADMDGEKVMMNIATGKYFGLDGVGSRIWELIERPHTTREVVQALQREYDVDEKTCQKDVVAFLNKLCTAGLVDVV